MSPDPSCWAGGTSGGIGSVSGWLSPTQATRLCVPRREEVLPKLHSDADYPCDLVGNWNTWYGEQDQAGEGEGKDSAGGRGWLSRGGRGVAAAGWAFGVLAPPPQPRALLPVHLWRFSGGYPALMDCMNKLKQNKVPPGLG